MEITFDPLKNESNLTKHGVLLADAALFEWDTAIIWTDNRFQYDEVRYAGIGYIGLRLFYIAFIERDETHRIISLRKANPREENRYAST